MASPYSSHGYQRLRELGADQFTYLVLVDDTGTEVTGIDITSDSRVQNTPDPSTNPLTYTVELEGSDSDVPNPVTIAETRLYESSSTSTPVGSDTMKNATVEALNDTLTITHEQSLPP